MRYWSPWDDRLLRALRGEFRINAPILTFALGPEGGVAVLHGESKLGLWVATGQHTYLYVPAEGRAAASTSPCDIMDIIAVSNTLFADFIGVGRTPLA